MSALSAGLKKKSSKPSYNATAPYQYYRREATSAFHSRQISHLDQIKPPYPIIIVIIYSFRFTFALDLHSF